MGEEVQNTKKRVEIKPKMVVAGGGAILVLLVGLVVWALLSGRISVVVKGTNQKVVLYTNVCNEKIINEYNAVFKTETIDEYTKAFEAVDKDVNTLTDYNKDPSCIYILFDYSMYIKDTKKAKQYEDELKEFNKNGLYLNGGMDGIESVRSMDKRLNPPTNKTGDSG